MIPASFDYQAPTSVDAAIKLLTELGDRGKVVANPSIGYGVHTISYADGSSREFYRIGLSANTAGISVYVLGLDDKTYLARTFGAAIGKASVTGYCVKFKRLSDINADALQAAMRHGMSLDQAG